MDKLGVGRSGQASSIVGAPLAAVLSSPFSLLIPNPIGVATVTAGMYCMSRYATDIGVRRDVVKVSVEDLALNLDVKSIEQADEEEEEEEDSDIRWLNDHLSQVLMSWIMLWMCCDGL